MTISDSGDLSEQRSPPSSNEAEDELSELRLKAACFDALMKNLPDSICIKDNECRYLLVNDVWLHHRTVSDLRSVMLTTDHDYYSPVLAEKFMRKDRTILRHREAQIGVIEKTEDDGEVKRISMTRIPVFDDTGEAIALIGISKDISSRTQIEKELAYERDILHTLLDHSRDAIYFKDSESRYLRISRAHPAMRFLDTPEQAEGKSDFDYFSPEHAEKARNDEKLIMRTGKPLLGLIEHETGPGIPERWVFTSKLPMFDKHGEIIGTFGLSRDITDIKKYENELYAAKNELEARVNQRTSDLQAANRLLEKRIAQLDFLTTASYEMAHCTELEALASVIIRAFTSRLYNGTAALCIRNEKRFTCIGITGVHTAEAITSLFEEAAHLMHLDELKSASVIRDWKNYFPDTVQQLFSIQYTCLTVIPLLADNRLIALLYLFSDDTLPDRLPEEEKVLLTLASYSAVSLSNAIYYKELGEKAQLQAELEAARSIQQRLTPRFTPEIPHISLKGFYSPAYEVGGDYLDYFKNDAGCWVVVIADVCGKGIPAALLMTLLRSAFRVEARHETSARNLLCSVNNSMLINLDDRSFVTAICLIISPDGSTMSYARAGHPRLIRITPSTHSIDIIQSDGMALGILPEMDSFRNTMDELTIPLNAGEHYFIYTDGLTDAFDQKKNTFGNERLHATLNGFTGSTPDALVKHVMRDIKRFTHGAPYHDDLTLIAFSVN